MKEIFIETLELIGSVYAETAKHPIITTVLCGLTLGLHIVLNIVFLGKEMPFNHIVLKPWMAFVNCLTMGIVTGSLTGYVAVKGEWN